MKSLQFGENVPAYNIPVLNEREVRAAAGLLFVLMTLAIQRIIYTWDFTLLRFAVTLFLADFMIRLFVSPRFSPTLILGRLIVRNQTPEYVGATQKKFAWAIGLILGLIIFVSLNVQNIHSPVMGIICLICQIFLFFESAFGICLGCMVYPWIFREKAQYCPGEVCDPKTKQPIQFTSKAQLLVLVLFFAAFFASIPMLKGYYAADPELIWGMHKPSHLMNMTH